jgi:hypothetical protein
MGFRGSPVQIPHPASSTGSKLPSPTNTPSRRDGQGRKALPKGLKSQPNHLLGKPFDAVMRVFVPYVTV